MTELTPEVLMAYADGELDEAKSREVERLLANDPEARATVDAFRRSTEILGEGLDAVLVQPVPQRLLDTVRGSDAKVVAMRPKEHSRNGGHWPTLAVAASLLLSIGIGIGAMLTIDRQDNATVADADPLQQVLETRPSGSPWVSEDEREQVTPVLTFRAADGRPCREFERETSENHGFGVACRESNGVWVTQIELALSIFPEDLPQKGLMPASGGSDPVSDVLDALGASRALEIDEEARLLKSGWD